MKKIALGNLLTKRETKFKKISGRKRLQKYEKNILKILTPSELLKTKEEKLDPKTYQRRIKQISKEYGPLTKEQEKELKYLTPGQFRKLNPKITTILTREEPEPIPEIPEPSEPEETKTKEKPDPIPMSSFRIDYDELPTKIKKMDHNGFLYENGFFSGGSVNFETLIDSSDMTVDEFIDIVVNDSYTEYIYNPDESGNIYNRREWEAFENE